MRKNRGRLAAAVAVVVLALPATAAAHHVFTDVPDGAFYSIPVQWAAENGITTGKTPTTFEPNTVVTRGEVVTFLKRYHDNVVAPELGAGEVVVMTHGTNAMVASSDDPPTAVTHHATGTDVTGDGVVLAAIAGPSAFGSTTYELASVEVCVDGTGGGSLTQVEVWAGGATPTNLASPLLYPGEIGCTVINVDGAPGGGINLALRIGRSAGDVARITGLTSTWQAAN